MSTTKKGQYLFICQNDDDTDLFIETKEGVDSLTNSPEEIDFKVIGRISTSHLSVDFTPDRIEWYDKNSIEEMGDDERKKLIDKAVLKIVHALTYGV